MDETRAILNAILENQQLTNAKLDGLTLEVRKLQGDVEQLKVDVKQLKVDVNQLQDNDVVMKHELAGFRQEMKHHMFRLDRRMHGFERDLDATMDRVDHLEAANT